MQNNVDLNPEKWKPKQILEDENGTRIKKQCFLTLVKQQAGVCG